MAAVAADMKKKPQDLQKFVDILEGEFLDTAESLKGVTDSQWKQMGIPVGLANKIKARLEAPEPTQKEDVEMMIETKEPEEENKEGQPKKKIPLTST